MPRFLAIDSDANGLYVALASVRGGSVKFERVAAAETEQPLGPASAKDLGAKLKELLKQSGIAPGPTYVCVGRERIVLKEVRFPPTSPSDEPAVVRFQATKDQTEALEDVVVDYQPFPAADPRAERQALVVFLRRDVLAAARVMCETAGLKLAGVTPRPFVVAAGVARAVATGAVPAPDTADAPIAVLSLTTRGGEFTVVRGGSLKYTRSIPQQAISSEAAIVAEVRRNLAVYAGQPGGADVEAVYLAEADSGSDGWSGRLRAGLPVPVYVYDPLGSAAVGGEVSAALHGRFAGPAGVFAARAGGQLSINFQQPRQPRAEANPHRGRILAGSVAAAMVLGFLVIGGYLLVDRADSKVIGLRTQLKQVEDDITAKDLDHKRLAAADEFMSREIVWIDELYDLGERFPDISKMRLTALEANTLPPPNEKERQKEEAALKLNPQAAKNPPAKAVAKLKLTVTAESPELPLDLVSSLKKEPRYYIGPRYGGGGAPSGAAASKSTTQIYSIETQLAHRNPDEYKKRLIVTVPKTAPAPKQADEKKRADDTENDNAGPIGGGSN